MSEKSSVSQAENRVKEMNRMTKQLLDKSNQAIQQSSPRNVQQSSRQKPPSGSPPPCRTLPGEKIRETTPVLNRCPK